MNFVYIVKLIYVAQSREGQQNGSGRESILVFKFQTSSHLVRKHNRQPNPNPSTNLDAAGAPKQLISRFVNEFSEAKLC